MGYAGIVLAYEAGRLARNNSDWYALLDVAAVRGTLIADAGGVYDPSDHNDRLLLGLRLGQRRLLRRARSPPVLHRTTQLGNYEELVERILELAVEGHQDTEIARHLTEEGFRSARLPYVTRPLVEKIRAKHGQPSLTGSQYCREKIDGCWSAPGLARWLGVSEEWVRKKAAGGTIPAERHPSTKRWLIPDDPVLLERLEKLVASRRSR